MNSPAQYLHIGFILISMANLIVIVLLIVVFVLAVTLRLPEKQHPFTLDVRPEREEIANKTSVEAEVGS